MPFIVQRRTESERSAHSAEAPIIQRKANGEGFAEQEAALVPPEAKGGGSPLPEGVRGKMEGAYGADFSGVRVHAGSAAPEAIDAEAYTQGQSIHFAPGRYAPGSESGDALLGHELAHVVQQSSGKAGQGQVQLETSPSLEREADEKGARAAKGEKVGAAGTSTSGAAGSQVVQRFQKVKSGSKSYPKKMKHRRIIKDKEIKDEQMFTSQKRKDESWYDDEGEAQLEVKSDVSLLISEAQDLAIQATKPGEEAKVFFATEERITEANKALVGSVGLQKGSRYLAIGTGKDTQKLYEVTPVGRSGDQKGKSGTDYKGPERCNEMARDTSGNKGLADSSAADESAPKMLKLLEHFSDRDWTREEAELREAAIRDIKAQPAWQHFFEEVADAYRDIVENEELAEEVMNMKRELKIDEAMEPQLGKALVSVTTVSDKKMSEEGGDKFGYHWGTVVAQSGADYITLENYARREGDLKAKSPLVFFRMHGPESTWHDKSQKSGDFLGPIMSFKFG